MAWLLGWRTGVARLKPLVDEFLVILVYPPKIVPIAVNVQPHMGDRNAPVVRVLGVVLVDHPHDR